MALPYSMTAAQQPAGYVLFRPSCVLPALVSRLPSFPFSFSQARDRLPSVARWILSRVPGCSRDREVQNKVRKKQKKKRKTWRTMNQIITDHPRGEESEAVLYDHLSAGGQLLRLPAATAEQQPFNCVCCTWLFLSKCARCVETYYLVRWAIPGPT